MFVHSDRLPATPAIPQGLVSARPWGLARMRPYPTMAPAARAQLDPITQTGVFYDGAGQVLEMGKHNTSTGTSPDGSGQGSTDTDSGSDSDQ